PYGEWLDLDESDRNLLGEVRKSGARFVLDRVTALDFDIEELATLGFTAIRLDAARYLSRPESFGSRSMAELLRAARVAGIDTVSHDVAIVRLALPPGASFAYYPGQYADVLLKDGSRRSYSMARRSTQDNQLEFHIRHKPGGVFSSYVFDGLAPRTLLRLEGPFGSFYLRDSERPMVLLASGTGFAPIQALLEQLCEQGNQRPAYLYWGGRVRADLYADAALQGLAREHDWFHYRPVLSEPTQACAWQGATGFVHLQVMEEFASLADFEVYACGAPVVVDSARRDYVEQLQLPPERFYADAFV
ncbi:MAG: FAD-binding oxidoreductase, partial [Pseudomonas sp.]